MKIKPAIITIAAALLCGCGTPMVPTYSEKKIVVTKDADGKTVSTVISEKVVQPGYNHPVQFEYLTELETVPRTYGGSSTSTKPPRSQ